jgi:hypothetical protein
MRTHTSLRGTLKHGKRLRASLVFTLLAILVLSSCLPSSKQTVSGGGQNITLYGFSILKEVLEKAIFPAFAAK